MEFLDSGVLTFNNSCIIDVFMVGGGSAGSNSPFNNGNCNAAGSAAAITKTYMGLAVKKGTSYPIVIGAGGAVSSSQYEAGGNGGNTSAFGQTAPGGTTAGGGHYSKGGKGGSGGGSGSTASSNSGATGGSDGSNGSGSAGGTGQGTTTREFAEATGKLYAGGGGGGTGVSNNVAGAWKGAAGGKLKGE